MGSFEQSKGHKGVDPEVRVTYKPIQRTKVFIQRWVNHGSW
jgi:hypothetical protein